MNIVGYQLSINTCFKKERQIILSSLFLIYYIVYAISPLSYTYTVKKIVEGISTTNGTSNTEKRLNIFLFELICAKIDPQKDVDQNNSEVRVLIRKARAILPENTNSNFAPPGNITLLEDISSRSDKSSPGRIVCFNQQSSRCQFNPLHSGLSPPSAQTS